MPSQQRKTHLDSRELQEAKEIAHLLDVQIDRAEELLSTASDRMVDIEYLYKEYSVRQKVKEIISRRNRRA